MFEALQTIAEQHMDVLGQMCGSRVREILTDEGGSALLALLSVGDGWQQLLQSCPGRGTLQQAAQANEATPLEGIKKYSSRYVLCASPELKRAARCCIA